MSVHSTGQAGGYSTVGRRAQGRSRGYIIGCSNLWYQARAVYWQVRVVLGQYSGRLQQYSGQLGKDNGYTVAS